jgi:hypothetical protein
MKIFHECPLAIFDMVQELTDGDYCLVHLMDENEEYRDKFIECRDRDYNMILDNSIFELGEAYDAERYHYWVKELNPTYFIIPDSLNNSASTLRRMNEWFDTREPVQGSKPMAVVQGNSLEELTDCYVKIAYDPRVAQIGISFDSACYFDAHCPTMLSREAQFMKGRSSFISYLIEQELANINKPHHLLGCSLPQEMMFYRNIPWITSVDTSNPVVNGLLNIKYNITGLDHKPSVKLFTLINSEVTEEQKILIQHNINMFRSFCH